MARSHSGPLVSSLLPPSPPPNPRHLSTEIASSLKLESTNRARRGCGRQTQTAPFRARGQRGRGGPRGGAHRKAGDRQKRCPQITWHRGGARKAPRGGDLGLGGITTAGQGSRDRNCRSGLRLGIHLDFKGNKRESCERRGTKLFLKGQNHNHFYLRFQILHSCHSV